VGFYIRGDGGPTSEQPRGRTLAAPTRLRKSSGGASGAARRTASRARRGVHGGSSADGQQPFADVRSSSRP